MGCYDGTYITHTTVAALDIPTVEQLVVLMMPWKVLVHQLYKSTSNICGNVLVEWRVKPDYISAALSFVDSCGLGRLWWGGLHVGVRSSLKPPCKLV